MANSGAGSGPRLGMLRIYCIIWVLAPLPAFWYLQWLDPAAGRSAEILFVPRLVLATALFLNRRWVFWPSVGIILLGIASVCANMAASGAYLLAPWIIIESGLLLFLLRQRRSLAKASRERDRLTGVQSARELRKTLRDGLRNLLLRIPDATRTRLRIALVVAGPLLLFVTLSLADGAFSGFAGPDIVAAFAAAVLGLIAAGLAVAISGER